MTDIATLRAWWAHRQGLDGSLTGASAAATLERTGWARSVGGSAPYLTLFARAGLDRATVDAEVAALAVHELPSARGCTYVLPAADFALGLALGAGGPDAEVSAAVKHLDVTRGEINKLCATVSTRSGTSRWTRARSRQRPVTPCAAWATRAASAG
jgi:hypothetical protein